MGIIEYNISPEEFKRTLAGFCGTIKYYEHKVTDKLKLLLTDGCEFVRKAANARWLFDKILLNQLRPEIRSLTFQVWILWYDKYKEGCWELRCEDGNKNIALVQMIIDSDFPIDEIRIWVIDGVAMLPNEY